MDACSAVISVATTTPPPLAEVRARFEAWRETKPHRNSPIPDALWEAALSLRAGMSMCAIGKALRLNPAHLADRARRQEFGACGSFDSGALAPSADDAGIRFVEIAPRLPDPAPSHVAGSPLGACQVLEIRFPDGTKVSATNADPVDVTPLFRALIAARR